MTMLLLVIFGLANAFFGWSFPAWFALFGEPDGLINPAVDKWIITPLAMAVYVPQYPSYAAVDRLTRLWSLPPLTTLVVVSLLSTVLYTPLLLGLQGYRKRRAA